MPWRAPPRTIEGDPTRKASSWFDSQFFNYFHAHAARRSSP
jgi:hypothetical protein